MYDDEFGGEPPMMAPSMPQEPMQMADLAYRNDAYGNPSLKDLAFDESLIPVQEAEQRLSADMYMGMGMPPSMYPGFQGAVGMEGPGMDESPMHESAEGEGEMNRAMAMEMLSRRAQDRLSASQHFQQQAAKLARGY